MLFQDISNFDKTSDYLPIFNAVLLTDILVMFSFIFHFFHSDVLISWYKKYTISAVITDVFIIVIGIIITRLIYPFIFDKFSLFKFAGLAIIVQIAHDVLFNQMLNIIPRGKNMMIDTFKDYAIEARWRAILADSTMIFLACIFGSLFASLNTNINIVLLIVLVYVAQYLIYSF